MITAYAPASIGNISCGFDIMGMAIQRPGDEVSVAFNKTGDVRIVNIQGDGGKLPYNPEKNTATVPMFSLLKYLGETKGVDVHIHKKMPFGSGLGSSAASAVAGAVALNQLLGNPLTKKELLPFALDGEAIASGARHADNVAPSLLGGITLISSNNPLQVISLPVPAQLYCTLVHPKVEILTKDARNVLPKQVSMSTAVHQMAHAASFVAALYTNNLQLLAQNTTDLLAEPYRKSLLPHFDAAKNAALYGGAMAFGISGSGPSMFAFSDAKSKAQQIALLLEKTFQRKKIACTTYTSSVNTEGAIIL